MNNKYFYIGILGITVFISTGCSSMTFSPQEYPVIEKSSGGLLAPNGVGIIATVATRRVVVINKKTHEFCAEPAPDATNNLISAVNSVISATTSLEGLNIEDKGKLAKLAAEAKANLTRNFSSTVSQVFKPTQGLKVLRDGWFAICQAKVNGIITESQFLSQFNNLLEKILGDSEQGSVGLIKAEFDYQIQLARINAPANYSIAKTNEVAAKTELKKHEIKLAEIERTKQEMIQNQLRLKLQIEHAKEL